MAASLKSEQGFKILEWVIYFILTGVAITFIVQGKVLDKYLKERSTFIQIEEPISENPTIISCVKPAIEFDRPVLGTDYGIKYSINNEPSSSKMHLYPIVLASKVRISDDLNTEPV